MMTTMGPIEQLEQEMADRLKACDAEINALRSYQRRLLWTILLLTIGILLLAFKGA
jgi:hypothetical protein